MLITARAISHSVQFVERFYEEYERLNGDKDEAVISSMAELLLPGSLAILTDAFGILVIYVSSIALMKKVALVGAFWAMSIAVTEMLLNRLMIAYFPAPKDTTHYVPEPIVKVLRVMSGWATGQRSARVILAVWARDRGRVVRGGAVREGRRVAARHADPLAGARVQPVGRRHQPSASTARTSSPWWSRPRWRAASTGPRSWPRSRRSSATWSRSPASAARSRSSST